MTRRKNKTSQGNERNIWRNWGDHPVVVTIGTISSLIAVIAIISSIQKTSSINEVINSTPTPFFETIPTPMNVLYYDNFSDESSGWDEDGYTTGWYKILHDSWHEKNNFAWETIGVIDGVIGIKVAVIGPFEKEGYASRGVVFGSNRGNSLEPFSFTINRTGMCKISRYYDESVYSGWRSIVEENAKNFDSEQSFYILELQITNYGQVKGSVDGKICIDTVLDDYAPGYVGLFATPNHSGPDYGVGESFFDDFFVFRP